MSESIMYDTTIEQLEAQCKAVVNKLNSLAPSGFYDSEDNNYFDDCLDIEYAVGPNGIIRYVKVCVALGGPNIYINTRTGNVEGRWWGDNCDIPIVPFSTLDAIEDYFNVGERFYL